MKKSEFVTWPAEPSLNLIQVKPLYQDLQTWCVLAILAGLRWTCRHGQISKISSRGVTVLFNVPQPQLDFFGPYGCVWKCRVPLNPMVLLIIIPIKWLFHWNIYPIFRQTHIETWAGKILWSVPPAHHCDTNHSHPSLLDHPNRFTSSHTPAQSWAVKVII